MPITLGQSSAITEMADLLSSYLPGSGWGRWQGHVSFSSIAQRVGVGHFYPEGSKTPAIAALLRGTLEHKRHLFERLVLEVVQAGLLYRRRQNNPIMPDDIDKLNACLLRVGVKIPDLWDPNFISGLRVDNADVMRQRVEAEKEGVKKGTEATARAARLAELKDEFFSLYGMEPQKAGFAFEKFLNELFSLFGLAPRGSFRVVGEQIDGAVELDHESHLVEARWKKQQSDAGELYEFDGKVSRKAAYTRGVFVALNGVTEVGVAAYKTGNAPKLFVVTGHDLVMVLEGHIDLVDFLRLRRRLLNEKGLVTVPFNEIHQ